MAHLFASPTCTLPSTHNSSVRATIFLLQKCENPDNIGYYNCIPCISFLVVETKYLKNDLRKEEFIFAHGLSAQGVTLRVGSSWSHYVHSQEAEKD